MQNQKSEIIRFEIRDEQKDFIIHLDEELLVGEGRELIKLLLQTLNAYKAAGAAEVARAFYAKYSAVDEKFLKMREYVIHANLARRLELNGNLVKYTDEYI